MKLGTMAYENEIYNLDYMTSSEIKELLEIIQNDKMQTIKKGKELFKTKEKQPKKYEEFMRIKTNDKYHSIMLKKMYEDVCNQIELTAKLDRIFCEKKTVELVNTKLNNQLNSMEVSINRINAKFAKKHKFYEKIREQMTQTLDNYEKNLRLLCNVLDVELEELILKKLELECKLVVEIIALTQLTNEKEKNTIAKGIDSVVKKAKGKKKAEKNGEIDEKTEKIDFIQKLETEIQNISKKITEKNQEKENEVFAAMETVEKSISTEIRKPHTFKKIQKFFVNKFNTYNVIMKNVIEPLNDRINEFKVNQLKKVDMDIQDFDLQEMENKIKEVENQVFEKVENKMILKKLEK